MAENSSIEWTDHTFNPWLGCTKISPGCDRCYAEAWSKRSGLVQWGKNPRRRTSEAYWRQPLRWQREAASFAHTRGRRQRVFCASLADVFDNKADAAWRTELFGLIRCTPDLDWLLLTKRPSNIPRMLPDDWGARGYSNVWLGFTAEDQKRFDERKQFIAEVPAALWFVSYEPAIGPLRLGERDPRPDWLISGGESGAGARPMNPQWARDVIADCRRLGISPFHKQWGNWTSNPLVAEDAVPIADAKARDPHGKGGGLLDGQIVREFPTTNYAGAAVA